MKARRLLLFISIAMLCLQTAARGHAINIDADMTKLKKGKNKRSKSLRRLNSSKQQADEGGEQGDANNSSNRGRMQMEQLPSTTYHKMTPFGMYNMPQKELSYKDGKKRNLFGLHPYMASSMMGMFNPYMWALHPHMMHGYHPMGHNLLMHNQMMAMNPMMSMYAMNPMMNPMLMNPMLMNSMMMMSMAGMYGGIPGPFYSAGNGKKQKRPAKDQDVENQEQADVPQTNEGEAPDNEEKPNESRKLAMSATGSDINDRQLTQSMNEDLKFEPEDYVKQLNALEQEAEGRAEWAKKMNKSLLKL